MTFKDKAAQLIIVLQHYNLLLIFLKILYFIIFNIIKLIFNLLFILKMYETSIEEVKIYEKITYYPIVGHRVLYILSI